MTCFVFLFFALDNDVQVLVRSRPDNGGKNSKSNYKDMKSKKKNSGSKEKNKGNNITQVEENSVSTVDRNVAVGSTLSELSREDSAVVMLESTKRLQGDERIVDAIDERVERGDRGGEVGGDRTGEGGESSELLGLGGGKGKQQRHLSTPQNVLDGSSGNINHVTSNHPTNNTTIARVVEGEVIGERIGARPGGSFSVGVLPAPLASPKVRNINK